MKAPNSQSFGAARAVLEHRDYSDGPITIKAERDALSEDEPDKLYHMETVKFFACDVMHIVHHPDGLAVACSFGGWHDSTKLRQLLNSMLMRLGIPRRVGVYSGSPYIYRLTDDGVDPISKVSPCSWFHVWEPKEKA